MFKFKTRPYAHQLEAFKKTAAQKNWALFMDMGTGKSKVIIDTLAWLSVKKYIRGALIVAPKGVYMNWIDQELPTHFPDLERPPLIHYWTAGATVAQRRVQDAFTAKRPVQDKRLKIMVMNVEAFSGGSGETYAKSFLQANGPAAFIIDESTTIKNHKSKRTKAILKLAPFAEYKRILSGNPSPNGPLDLFSQGWFLDPKLLGMKSWYEYRNRFCLLKVQHMGPRSFQVVTGYRNLDELGDKLSHFSTRVRKDECLDLPPKIYQIREVELTAEQRLAYKDMKRDAYVELDGMGTVTATAVITKMLRLHQIVMGRIPLDEEGGMINLPSHRMDALMDTVAEVQDPKVIIWANYRPDIMGIQAALAAAYGKESVVSYWGDTSRAQRPEVIKQFQDAQSPVRFIVGNAMVGGWGVNLSRSHTSIYFSNDYNLDKRMQSEARPDRIGQEADHILYIDLIAKGTVDEKIVRALRDKLDISSAVLKDNWREWLV